MPMKHASIAHPATKIHRKKVVRVLVVTEGVNDIEFLRRISLTHSLTQAHLPSLAELEQLGELVFVPTGGGQPRSWLERLAPFQVPTFVLLDHEIPPEADLRKQTAAWINQQEYCEAVVTSKRSLENYLHPNAIREVAGIGLTFGDFEPVAELAAKRCFEADPINPPWHTLTCRAHRRMTNRAKRWLNSLAVEAMTPDWIAERDPQGEILAWLTKIGRLAQIL